MKKFLIIQTAFIGDVVLATVILEKLHNWFPSSQIDILVRKGNETLFTGHPFLREVLVWDKKTDKLKNLWTLLKKIRKNKYEMVINAQRFAATGLLTAFSGAGETIGFDKNPFSFLFTRKIRHVVHAGHEIIHETERNLKLIERITNDSGVKPKLYPTPSDEEAVNAYRSQPYLTIAPASVWFTKQYPKEKWIDFIQKIPAHYSVYLLGAPGDMALCEEIINAVPGRTIGNLCGKLSFLQSAALMRTAVMNYVNDSAPMHFASAVNAPVTAVYCSTIPAFGFGPLSDKRFIVEILEPLDCRPCGLHGYRACPLGHFNCAKKITDYQLLNTIL